MDRYRARALAHTRTQARPPAQAHSFTGMLPGTRARGGDPARTTHAYARTREACRERERGGGGGQKERGESEREKEREKESELRGREREKSQRERGGREVREREGEK